MANHHSDKKPNSPNPKIIQDEIGSVAIEYVVLMSIVAVAGIVFLSFFMNSDNRSAEAGRAINTEYAVTPIDVPPTSLSSTTTPLQTSTPQIPAAQTPPSPAGTSGTGQNLTEFELDFKGGSRIGAQINYTAFDANNAESVRVELQLTGLKPGCNDGANCASGEARIYFKNQIVGVVQVEDLNVLSPEVLDVNLSQDKLEVHGQHVNGVFTYNFSNPISPQDTIITSQTGTAENDARTWINT